MTGRRISSAAAILTALTVLVGCSGEKESPEGPAALSATPAATDAIDPEHLAKAQKLINGGLRYLLAAREADGGWSLGGRNKPAITAMVLKALVQHPDFDARSPVVKRGLDVMLSFRQKDGGIYHPAEGVRSYTTAIAIMALTAAQEPRFKETIRDAVDYLKDLQIKPGSESPDGEPITADSPRIGGVGYGSNGEPNLSVLGFVIEAWEDAGVPDDDPHVQSAVAFLSHLHNRSESNPLEVARQGPNDGGFFYDLKNSKAGAGPGGRGLRSYGTMTYVGFKTMLYAGVARDDPRVQAAYDWIRRYWRLDSNPNMPQVRSKQGLYYYYHVFAKALRVWGQPVIADMKGIKHNWRHELIDALAGRVGSNGEWKNDAVRWGESDPILATCYSLLALQEALMK